MTLNIRLFDHEGTRLWCREVASKHAALNEGVIGTLKIQPSTHRQRLRMREQTLWELFAQERYT